MPSRSVWASDDEWARWAEAAAAAGVSLNGWLRLAADDQAELEASLRREERDE